MRGFNYSFKRKGAPKKARPKLSAGGRFHDGGTSMQTVYHGARPYTTLSPKG